MTFSPRAIEAALDAFNGCKSSNDIDAMQDALSAALAVDGVALVPVEATEGQIEMGARALCKVDGLDPDADWRCGGGVMLNVAIEPGKEQRWRTYARKARDCYRAMLAAASDGDKIQ